MKVYKIEYTLKCKDGKVTSHTRTEEVVEDNSPLAQAVELEVTKHPSGTIVVGVGVNEEIKYVGPLEDSK